jgi:hypothetical protein
MMSWNSNTLDGLEILFFVGIHRILAELPPLTELELRKVHRTQTDSGRPSTLELLRGLSTYQEVLWPSEPDLSLYSTKNKLGSTIGS